MSDDRSRNAVIRRLVDAFNRQDVDAAVSLFTDDAVVSGCDIWTFDGDLIARKDSFWKIAEP